MLRTTLREFGIPVVPADVVDAVIHDALVTVLDEDDIYKARNMFVESYEAGVELLTKTGLKDGEIDRVLTALKMDTSLLIRTRANAADGNFSDFHVLMDVYKTARGEKIVEVST